MQIYNNNLKYIKEYRAELYEKNIDIFEGDKGNDSIVSFLEARDNSLYMQYENDGNSVRFNSSYAPVKEAAQWVEQYNFKGYNSVVVMYGIGSGHFVRALMETLNERALLIIVEPKEDVFVSMLKNIDMSDIIEDNRIILLFGEKGLDSLFTVITKHVPWNNVNNMTVLKHPLYDKVFEEEYKKFMDSVNDAIEYIATEGNTESYFGRTIAYNTAANLKYTMDSYYYNDFVGVFDEDTVGIIVAAGPSLDNNIKVLHMLKEKSVIIATDTALRRLHEENVVPDFVVSVDPEKPIEMFTEVGFENIPFFCKIDCNPEVLDMHKGVKIWVNPSNYHEQLYARLGIGLCQTHSGGSVATTAFKICYKMGLKNIVLIGQDLAYKGEYTHTGAITDTAAEDEKDIKYVKGNYEEKVKTRGDWLHYLKWYERTIRNISVDGVTVINATEGGAYIEGTKLMTLQEVADTLCTKDRGITKKIESVLTNRHDDYSGKILEFIEESISDLKNMIRLLDKGITACNRFDRKYSKSRTMDNVVVQTLKDIQSVNNKVNSMTVYFLVDEMVKAYDKKSVNSIYDADEDEYTSNINMIKNTKHIFELSQSSAKELLPEFEKTMEIIKTSLEK